MSDLNFAMCSSTESVAGFRMNMSCLSKRCSSSRLVVPYCSSRDLKIAAAEVSVVMLTLCSYGIASMRKAFALIAVRGSGLNADSGSDGRRYASQSRSSKARWTSFAQTR